MIKITRQRPASMREDFLVRGIGDRAIHVVLPFDAMLSEPISETLSEYELYWIIVVTAKFVVKHYSWKTFILELPHLAYGIEDTSVWVKNCSQVKIELGTFKSLVDLNHFTNDFYLCPKYFYIPKYKVCKSITESIKFNYFKEIKEGPNAGAWIALPRTQSTNRLRFAEEFKMLRAKGVHVFFGLKSTTPCAHKDLMDHQKKLMENLSLADKLAIEWPRNFGKS